MSTRPASFFDLDKTIIAKSSAFAFGRPLYHGGMITRASMLQIGFLQLMFALNSPDEDDLDRQAAQMSALVKGWNVFRLRRIVADTLDEMVGPFVYAEARRLINGHHALGHDVVVVSASGREMVEPIARAVGATRAVATRLEVVDGHFTGGISFFCKGENKAIAIRELADHNGYDLARSYAYSDSISDLPMLELVGHPVAVNPDRPLRKEALARGWPIQRFSHPVPLRERMPRSTLYGLGVGLGVGLAAVVGIGAVKLAARSRSPRV